MRVCVRASATPAGMSAAMCSPSQAVAQVMIHSFQLSSCALFNAQMQDVSVHSGVFLCSLWPILGCASRDSDSRVQHIQAWALCFTF